jgi:hypothetical protein
MEVGTLSQPPQRKAVPRSSFMQAATTIVLSCIPEGLRIIGNILGHMEKLRYSYHHVTINFKLVQYLLQTNFQ